MKLKTINDKHESLLKSQISFIKGIAYEATEDCEEGKFEDYNDILNNIIKYTNKFQKLIEENNKDKEWVYMSPNLMLYSCMGFLSGIRNDENNNTINRLSELLFERTIDMVNKTSLIIEDIDCEQSKKDKIELIKIKRNEYNS